MRKEEFDILLKARNIMVNQAHAALKYLNSCDIETAVKGHYKLYLTAYNAYNNNVSLIILESMQKYLPIIKDAKMLADVYCVMASDYVRRDKFSEAINLYFQYKSLQIDNKKLDYNFDGFMLHILGENDLYEKFKSYSLKMMYNPYLLELDAYGSVVIYYNNIIIAYENKDTKFMKKNIDLINKLIKTERSTDYPELCLYFHEICNILYRNYHATTEKQYIEIINAYRDFLAKYEDENEIHNIRIVSAHLFILRTFIKCKYYKYVINSLKLMLNLDIKNKAKVYIYEMLITCYKQTNNEKYVKTLETLAILNADLRKKLQANINEGILNSIRFYETQNNYDKIKKRYEIDYLTGCYTRSVMRKKILNLFEEKGKGSILFIDLDNLKEANDNYNHSYGDEYLRVFVNGVSEVIDQSSLMFRYGGDEFVVATSNNNPKKAEKVIQKINKKFKKPVKIYDEMIKVEFSAGVALFPDDGESFEEVLNKADAAMYEAKKGKQD